MENRNGMLIDFVVSSATGTAECDAIPVLLDDARQRGFRPKTFGGDRCYDTRWRVTDMPDRGVVPHVAQRAHSAIDGRTTRHPGYGVSQKIRRRIEEIFGWMKTVGGFRRTRYRGVEGTGLAGYFVATAYNLVRMANLLSCLEPPSPFRPCDLSGAHCAQNGLTGSPRPCESSPEPSAEAQNPLQSRLHRPLNQLRRTGKSYTSVSTATSAHRRTGTGGAVKLTLQQLEAHLWGAANILRGKTAGQDYKNYILSLMFYKRLCDQWEREADDAITELERQQEHEFTEAQKAIFRKRGEHRYAIPDGARWGDVKAVSTNIGEVLTGAMQAVASANQELRGVFTVDWNQPAPARQPSWP